MQSDVVVVVHEAADQAPSILDIERRTRSNGLGFNRSVPALNLPVGLRIIRRSPYMRHPAYSDELLEILGYKLRPVIGDNARRNRDRHIVVSY